MPEASNPPLGGTRVILRASGVAAAYAGRLLATMGAETILLEPPEGTALRREPPFLEGSFDEGGEPISALFAYLCAGMRSFVCDLESASGHAAATGFLSEADIFIDDTPLDERPALGLDEAGITRLHPDLVHVSVLPFGATGPKSNWKAVEINLQHASGEGNLLPNGLSIELFPDRPPVKIYGNFAELQGGIAAALGALSALWVRDEAGGQYVDISSQDAALAVGAFAIQRYGDGSLEHRAGRSFRYGGVLACADGYVELLTLEQRQWTSLVTLLGNPEWAQDPALADSVERSRQGPAINAQIRAWAKIRRVADIVAEGQAAGVPLAKYTTPLEVLRDPHEQVRGLFAPVEIGGAKLDMLVAPFQFGGVPLPLTAGPPQLGEFGRLQSAETQTGTQTVEA